MVQANFITNVRSYLKNKQIQKQNTRAAGSAQVVKLLPGKHKALSLIPISTKHKPKKELR
jgi:hypothetical protein